MGQHQPLKEILLFLYANIFFQGELDSNQAKPGCLVARLPGCQASVITPLPFLRHYFADDCLGSIRS